jgi:glycosyltransferase involved in cell wall biosynthesis
VALFSVLMPAYNAQAHIGAAITSILEQRLGDFEFLILDDGSEDDTARIVRRFEAIDRRIRFLPSRRQGQVASRNELMHTASTEIIAWADADDISLPHRFEIQYPEIAGRPNLDALGTMMIVVDGTGAQRGRMRYPVGCEAVSLALEKRVAIAQPASMLRRRRAIELGGFRAAYEGAEDYDFFLRMSERGQLDNVDVYGVLYRENPNGVSHTNSARQSLSADLARAAHRFRARQLPDPTLQLADAPELDDPVLDLLLPNEIRFHRAIAAAATGGVIDTKSILRELLRLRFTRRQARLAQRTIATLLRHRPLDILGLRAMVRGLALGPRRFIKALMARA